MILSVWHWAWAAVLFTDWIVLGLIAELPVIPVVLAVAQLAVAPGHGAALRLLRAGEGTSMLVLGWLVWLAYGLVLGYALDRNAARRAA